VAAVYLSIVNTGGTVARLAAVTSDIAGTVMPITETTSCGGVGSMLPLQDVVVPAHCSFRFHPGAAHLVLEQPHPVPTAGSTVPDGDRSDDHGSSIRGWTRTEGWPQPLAPGS
jgi:copper(I)-binding protein